MICVGEHCNSPQLQSTGALLYQQCSAPAPSGWTSYLWLVAWPVAGRLIPSWHRHQKRRGGDNELNQKIPGYGTGLCTLQTFLWSVWEMDKQLQNSITQACFGKTTPCLAGFRMGFIFSCYGFPAQVSSAVPLGCILLLPSLSRTVPVFQR